MDPSPDAYQKLEAAALELSPDDRARLLDRLLVSLHEDESELSPEWSDEIQRRLEDIDSGRSTMIPGEQVWSEIHQRLDEMRRSRN